MNEIKIQVLKNKIEKMEKNKNAAYEAWIKCQQDPGVESFSKKCKKLYANLYRYTTDLQDLESKLYAMKHHTKMITFEEYQKSIKDSPSPSIQAQKTPKFPETVIVSVNIHGGYDVNAGGDDLTYFKLPKGVSLRTITAVPAGVCYFPGGKNTGIPHYIAEHKDDHNALFDKTQYHPYQDHLDYVVKHIANFARTEDKSYVDQFAKHYVHKKRKAVAAIYDKEMADFSLYHSDKMYHVDKYLEGDEVPNKGFQVQYKDIFMRKSRKYDSEINVLNMTNAPNLLDTSFFNLKQDPVILAHGIKFGSNIELEDVITYLTKYGAKDIILIDFSCSVLMGDKVTDRSTRRIRLNATRESHARTNKKRHRSASKSPDKKKARTDSRSNR